jgi:hypothetical protein
VPEFLAHGLLSFGGRRIRAKELLTVVLAQARHHPNGIAFDLAHFRSFDYPAVLQFDFHK